MSSKRNDDALLELVKFLFLAAFKPTAYQIPGLELEPLCKFTA